MPAMAAPNRVTGTASELTSTTPTRSMPMAWNCCAARRLRCRSSAAVRPSSLEPTTTRSGAPSAAISNRRAMFTPAGSVRAGEGLGALDVQRVGADGQRRRARLGAQDLETRTLVFVPLAQLCALVEPGLDRRTGRLGVERDHRMPAAPQVNRLAGCTHHDHLGGVCGAAEPFPRLQ